MDNTNFEAKLSIAGLTKQAFSDLSNIPYGTICNWITSRKGKKGKIPNWVEPYLNLYIENKENLIHIKKLHKELKEGIL